MGFWAAAAPSLIGLGSSLVSSLFGKKENKSAIPPEVTAAMKEAAADRAFLRSGRGRGQLIDPATGKVLRMRLPGVGGSQEGFDASMDAFLNLADFALSRDQDLTKALLQLNQQASPGAASAGQAQNFLSGQKATGALATTLADLGAAGLQAWQDKKAEKAEPAPTAPVSPETLDFFAGLIQQAGGSV